MRTAIALLLQKPALAELVESTERIEALQLPGIELLVELIQMIHARPAIGTGALLEHFAARDEARALEKLSVETLLQDPEQAEPEFSGTLLQLELLGMERRRTELGMRLIELSAIEKAEYREMDQRIHALKQTLKQSTVP